MENQIQHISRINTRHISYELKDVYDRLDLLLPDACDPQYNQSSIIDYVYETWPIKDSFGKEISTWTDLFVSRLS